MAEDELLRPVFREVHRQRPGAFIGQMAVIGRDPALEIDRVRPGAQQLRVVVGLNDGAVHTAQRRAHGIRHGAEVGAETEARRPVEPVAAAPGRVMRRGKRRHAHIAEANMMGVAAGLSTMGYVPFVSSFAMFAAGRAFEQIRNSVAYPHLNVKIGATHGGISVGEDGASHQCCEDFALMRSLPGMTIICPADDVEARAAVRAAYEMQGPVYLRFGRLAVPVFHDEANYHFEIGKGEQLTDGNDIAIVATGLMVNEARKAAETLAAEGIHARVINIHTIKPLDEDIILKAARECGKIVTAEEHNVIGGLGEAVCSLLSEKLPTPVRRVGVQDKFGCSGPAWDLLKEYGLDAATICKTAKEMLGK